MHGIKPYYATVQLQSQIVEIRESYDTTSPIFGMMIETKRKECYLVNSTTKINNLWVQVSCITPLHSTQPQKCQNHKLS